jgi:outer membrane protein assembly factor BamA
MSMAAHVARPAVFLFLIAGVGGVVSDARAQPPAEAPAGTTPTDSTAQSTDVGDLWRLIRHKPPPTASEQEDYRRPARAIAPTISSKPSSGLAVGVGASLARFLGTPETTHISSMLAAASISTKGQTSLTARFDAFGDNNWMHVQGDNRFQWTSQDTYGLGTSTPPEAAIGAKFTHVRVFETALFDLDHHIAAGGGIAFSSHSSIRPVDSQSAWDTAPPDAYAEAHGFDPASQTSAGGSAAVEYNTRDNPINASRGWLASAVYRAFFKGFFGGDSTWQELVVDIRRFVTLRSERRRMLAFWLYGESVVNGVAPYFDLPAIGLDTYGRTGRGYAEGRFRGEQMLYGEVEYRQTLRRDNLLGLVVFANTSTFSNHDTGERLFDSFAPAGGAGLRVLFSKRSGANLCVDYGIGRHSRGFYLALQEAF